MINNKKSCPLCYRSCNKEGCAWWNITDEQCVILSLMKGYKKPEKVAEYGDCKSYQEGYQDGYQAAMSELNTPVPVLIEDWNPSICPTCHKDFSDFEPCDDGFYKRVVGMERCPYCGQMLDWSEVC